ncbi:MAG: hypothetical protein EOL86_11600 [Deltaproteobacteria bacterium]|nr:hypothetical protein [Deltaproteobacteria bacterium]
MKCFYHSADLDGHCSGAIVKMAEPECEMFPIDYGQPFPWDSIRPGEVVMMVDFSLQPFADMVRLNELATLVWIDHHKTALDDAAAAGARIDGIQREGLGACALVWEWFHRGETMPYSVRLLAEYDVWDHHDTNCQPFQYGLRLENTWPEAEVWRRLLRGRGSMADIILHGVVALRADAKNSAVYAASCAYETTFGGLRCIAMNRMCCNSRAFDSVVDPGTHDAMLAWGWRAGKWTVSLYSTREDVDVSVIARRYGGGGHKGAAGFQCQGELPAGVRP